MSRLPLVYGHKRPGGPLRVLPVGPVTHIRHTTTRPERYTRKLAREINPNAILPGDWPARA